MTVDGRSFTWIAAIHASRDDFKPLGTAVIIDANRLLTCAHVVMSRGTVRQELWVSFPRADDCPRRQVAAWAIAYSPPVEDLAVLVLQDTVPAEVEAAPLRCPKGDDLVGHMWWAFGFPNHDPVGNSAEGQVGASLGYGRVRLDTNSRYALGPGFSGSGLWSPDYGAVVGIIGEVHGSGDGRAVTLHQADLILPNQMLATLATWSAEAAGEMALSEWGWVLARDLESVRHWQPRARGVNIQSEPGYLFRGREAALNAIVQWLDRAIPDQQVLVITGSPGAGKSAVLGRIVTTADPALRAALPRTDVAVRGRLGSVHCAVHAKGKTALEIAREIARAASARMPEVADDLASVIRNALAERGGRRFNVIIDALDEAVSPEQARATVEDIVLPLAESCSDLGVQIVVGTRPRDDGGDLLASFSGSLVAVNLDDSRYFAEEDLTAYVLACLQLRSDERHANPYRDSAIARPLAVRISAMSGRNFLVAGLLARSHGLHDRQAVDPDDLGFTDTVDSALTAYLDRLAHTMGLSAEQALTALAFAETPGWSPRLWQLAAQAIYGTRIDAEDLAQFAQSAAANFLIQASEEGGATGVSDVSIFRLFHQALNDALLRRRSGQATRTADELAIASAFMEYSRLIDWDNASPYLLRSLPQHAAAGGLVDELLADDAYLLHVDLRRLSEVTDNAISAQGRSRARLIQLTPFAISASPAERAALFSVTEALEGLGSAYKDFQPTAPYSARWAAVRPHGERIILEGYGGSVYAVCPVSAAGRDLLAAAYGDGKVRIWDLHTGEQHTVLEVTQDKWSPELAAIFEYGVCPVSLGSRELLATCRNGTIQIWDPDTGNLNETLDDKGWDSFLCPVTVAGRPGLATAELSNIRIWDLGTGEQHAVLRRWRGRFYAMCPVTVADRQLLAVVGRKGKIWIWDLDSGKRRVVLRPGGRVRRKKIALCPITMGDRQLLATVSGYGKIQIWDPDTGKLYAALSTDSTYCDTICGIVMDGRPLLATGGLDGTVRIWDPSTGEPLAALAGHESWIRSICPVLMADRELLATAGDDGTVRIWNLGSALGAATLEEEDAAVGAVCPVSVAGQELLAAASEDRIRLWHPDTGQQYSEYEAKMSALCPIAIADRTMLAIAGEGGAVVLWDPTVGKLHAMPVLHGAIIIAMCPVLSAGRELLATAGEDGRVRLWDLHTGKEHSTLARRRGEISAITSVSVAGRHLLATADDNGTRIRFWDPGTGRQYGELDADDDWVTAMCPITVAGRQALATGSLNGIIRIWDLGTGEELAIMTGHDGYINAASSFTIDGQELLVTAGNDRTVRVWESSGGECLLIVPTHHSANAVAWIAESLAIALDTGILTVKPRTGSLSRERSN